MIVVEERRLKGLLKDALAEVLEEHRDLLHNAVRDGLEDIALIRAIQLGEKTSLVHRNKIFRHFKVRG